MHLHLDVLSSNLLSYKGATLLKLQLEIQAVTSNIHLHSGKADGFLCDNILKIFALLKLYKSRDLQNGELSIHLFITIQCLPPRQNLAGANARFGASPSMPVPQNALVKFVRNAPPCLRWFRSDLTRTHEYVATRTTRY